jgi:hypothetical protein
MEFRYLQLILAFSGDDLGPVKKLGKLHRTYPYRDVHARQGGRIFLLSTRQRVQLVKLRCRGAATRDNYRDQKKGCPT